MLRTPDEWFAQHGAHYRHPLNRAMHWIGVPLTIVAVVGLLWSLPVPQAFRDISPALNWGTTFVMATCVYYFILSFSLAVGMLPFMLAIALIVGWLDTLAWPLWAVSLVIFIAAWTGQIIGHIVEGRALSFFRDMQWLMIAPVRVLAWIYRRLGIPY